MTDPKQLKEYESLLKKRGKDTLQAVSLIAKFIEESSYTIKDSKDDTLPNLYVNGEFVCKLVNCLNKHGYLLAKKEN